MSLGLVRPCQVSFTASKTTSTTPSQAQARSASEHRPLVALTEGLEALEGVYGLDGELGEGDHGRDLADVLELFLGELREGR